MFTETQLHFFKEKINAVETALLINQSESVLRLPNRIVRVSHIDDVGQVWILVPRPMQHLSEFEKTFPVKLQFALFGLPALAQVFTQTAVNPLRHGVNQICIARKVQSA